MAYVTPNFKTKSAMRDAIAAGKEVRIFQPNNIFGVTFDGHGSASVEGPHYPQPHRWYARVEYTNGFVTAVTK